MVDEVRLKNILSNEVHVTQQKCDKVRACVHAQVLCIFRVFMFM